MCRQYLYEGVVFEKITNDSVFIAGYIVGLFK